MDIVKTDTFGNAIRKLRVGRKLPLRKVAAFLDIDQAILSKIERGIRRPQRNIVIKLAEFYKVNVEDLLAIWLSDKIAYELQNEPQANNAMHLAEQKLAYQRTVGLQKSAILNSFRTVLNEFPVIKKAWLFGSFVRGEEISGSDIDILIEVTKGSTFTLFDLAELQDRLSELAGRNIDIVMERALKPDFKKRIQPDMRLFYEAR